MGLNLTLFFLYEIVFSNGGDKSLRDNNVKETIISIIEENLDVDNVTFYIASTDHRTSAEARSTLFSNWNDENPIPNYNYIDISMHWDGFDLYRGMIIHPN